MYGSQAWVDWLAIMTSYYDVLQFNHYCCELLDLQYIISI